MSSQDSQIITGNIVDIFEQKVYPGQVKISGGRISGISALPSVAGGKHALPYIMPGFIDAHVHVESSMLVPSEFARLAVVHGTVGSISDPHEIANVCGLPGVDFMIRNGAAVPFKFNFGAPSCVPATFFETAGAALYAADVRALLERPEIRYLSEMMNFPGVLNKDPEVMAKIAAARALAKPVDGHAPGLRGQAALDYINAGISTDHECFTAEEALDKLKGGMKILIREGSAARNFDALAPLLHDYSDQMMFCSDDKHPDSLVEGHINQLCARAVALGIDLFKVLKAACINPAVHYHTNIGLLRQGDAADFIIVRNLHSFEVESTYIDGILVAKNGVSRIAPVAADPIAVMRARAKTAGDFRVPFRGESFIPVIEALDGQLITNRLSLPPVQKNGDIVADPQSDILKLALVNRYADAPPALAFIRNFGLQSGALASSVAHDSHNIVAVGADDESLCRAINLVIESQGGISAVNGSTEQLLALPIAGLMSGDDGYSVARSYTAIDGMAKEMGSKLRAPFMTLSFMALLVIPHLKLSDKGLFDGDAFKFWDK